MRWAARAIGLVAALFFVFMLIGSAVSDGVGPMDVESSTMVLLVVVALAGCIVSWWRYAIAGMLLVLTSIGFGVHIGFFAGHSHALAWSMVGLPYLIAGVLLLLSFRFSIKTQ